MGSKIAHWPRVLSHGWSHVLFPGEPEPLQPRRFVRVCEWILLVVAALLSFSSLDCPLQEPEETLYAEVPRQMLAEDRLLVPVRHGQAYYDKPPLLYWLVMAAYRLFGVHDWAARSVSAGAAFLVVLVAYVWGKHTIGPRAAFAGALMLSLSPRYAQMARMLTTNSLLTLWVVAALATAHLALTGERLRRRWWLVSAIACALACLTKGPVGLVLVGVPVLLFQLLDRRTAPAGIGAWLAYLGVVGFLAFPWFVIVSIRDADFVDYFVWTHHVRRFLDPIDHLQPVWYYVPLLLLGMAPWTLLLPGLAQHLASRAPAVVPQRTGALGFLLLAALWGFVFFSASGCKRPSYLLPVMPPLALALGAYVDVLCSPSRMRTALWAGTAAASFVALFLTAQLALPWYADRYSLRAQLVPHVDACAGAVPVMCYPHRWDGVSYYLERNDVRVFRPAQLSELAAALSRHRQSLVVVKCDASLEAFCQALPESLEFVPCSCREPVAVGWVRKR
jgi:4-amino-4-deoxy-L-arabinose transferase-like glycosyltransferase